MVTETFASSNRSRVAGAAGAYVLMSPPEGADSVCWTWIDALDGPGIVRAHAVYRAEDGRPVTKMYEFALCLLERPGCSLFPEPRQRLRLLLTGGE